MLLWRRFDKANQIHKHFKTYLQWPTYPEMDDDKCALWAFKQQLTLKLTLKLLLFSCKRLCTVHFGIPRFRISIIEFLFLYILLASHGSDFCEFWGFSFKKVFTKFAHNLVIVQH